MYCRECGNGVKDNADICTNCGVRPLNSTNYCQSCGTKTNEKQELCVNCGVGLHSAISSPNDKPSVLLNLAVCCFPLVGIILYFVWKNEKPKSAKSVCLWAIIGTALGVVLYIIAFVLGMASEMMYY